MGKRLFIPLAIVLVAGLGEAVWWVGRPHEPLYHEPLYQGKSLSFWLEHEDPYFVQSRAKLGSALRLAGTNALPVLLRNIQAKDTPLIGKLINYVAERQPFFKISHHPSASERRVRAVYGFRRLGAEAKGAVPALLRIYDQDTSMSEQTTIGYALGWIGPAAEEAIPALLMRTTNGSQFVRAGSIFALGRIHSEPELVVPVLTKSLGDPEAYVRYRAASGLKTFGADARSAVPALLALYESWDANWRRAPKAARRQNEDEFEHEFTSGDEMLAVEEALKAIDSKAAAKAGVK